MWVNDNIGAIQWVAAQKCFSMASHYANLAVTQLRIIARLRMVPPVHKPGIEMGDIAPSGPRKPDNEGNPKAMSDPHANYHAQFTTRTTAEAVPATRPTPNPPEHT